MIQTSYDAKAATHPNAIAIILTDYIVTILDKVSPVEQGRLKLTDEENR